MGIAAVVLFAACDPFGTSPPDRPGGTRYFRFVEEASQETFVAATSDSATIALVASQLRKALEDRKTLIAGPIERGDGLYPDEYPWHFVPGKWTLTDVATEVCDGRPSSVSKNVDYFVDEVGRYCPFGSRVMKEVEPPDQ